jgi:hypothetical protein
VAAAAAINGASFRRDTREEVQAMTLRDQLDQIVRLEQALNERKET